MILKLSFCWFSFFFLLAKQVHSNKFSKIRKLAQFISKMQQYILSIHNLFAMGDVLVLAWASVLGVSLDFVQITE